MQETTASKRLPSYFMTKDLDTPTINRLALVNKNIVNYKWKENQPMQWITGGENINKFFI